MSASITASIPAGRPLRAHRPPDRVKTLPTAEGFQEAWGILQQPWAATEDRARRLPADLLHERVGDEWSFVHALRHLEEWQHRLHTERDLDALAGTRTPTPTMPTARED